MFVLAGLAASGVACAQTLDRVVAAVNDDVITLSDWQQYEDFNALVDGHPPATQLDPAALDRLVDRILLMQQVESVHFNPVGPADVDAEEAKLRKQLHAEDEGQWETLLSRYQLQEADFRRLLSQQLDVMRFIDLRFRPTIRVEQAQVRDYYQTTFLPAFRKTAGAQAAPPKLEDVQRKIRAILVEQGVDEQLAAWIKAMHEQGRVQIMLDPPEAAGPGQ